MLVSQEGLRCMELVSLVVTVVSHLFSRSVVVYLVCWFVNWLVG